jgi:ribosome maturation factor RimP
VVVVAPTQRVRDVVDPVVTGLGLVLEEVHVRRAGAQQVVEIAVGQTQDDEAELDLDRVAVVTAAISDALDAADPVAGEYTLEVGTRGADAPLRERRHFARAVGRSVKVRTEDGTTIAGRLTGLTDDGVVVVPVTPGVKGRPPKVGAPVTIALAAVREARVEVDLAGLGPEVDDAGQES